MVGGGNRRDEASFTVSNTNVFAAMESLRKKKKSDKEKGSSKGGKGTSKAGGGQNAEAEKQVFWAPAPLTVKSWADVDDEDDDDYYATTAPPQALWGASGLNAPEETHKQPDDVVECRDALWKACWAGGEEREKLKKEAEAALEILEGEIKGKRFFGGDNIGLVDIVGSFIAFWIPILQETVGLHILTKEKFPNVWKWSEELCEESTVKECLPEKEKIVWGLKKAYETGNLY